MTYKRSFTLLESIIAIYVFLLGIVGAMTLANSAISSSSTLKDQLIAAGLAQEGQELVRAMRDNKFLQLVIDTTSCPPLTCDANKAFDPSDATKGGNLACKISSQGCRITNPVPADLSLIACTGIAPTACMYLLKDATGRYQYAGGTQTKFDRRIYFVQSALRDAAQGIYDWEVHSIVTWKGRFGSKSYEVITQLTPWLR